ncbi:outer membrane homotrimeric porin [Mailhella massiliensis]|uniref:Outer membrane homotrimeric porin n=1 Tax=Mailhella massiliensis TaxID=1903261 RepID=A0A921AX22_9BACT|nr:outer membrane homotrimeric porin [Mailhella massiliensis]HJD97439.1 outer membrane homotrimeric porin [Mailhella massiliensis]
MKKLTTLLLAAGMVFAASAPASAVDVKVDGDYNIQFTQGRRFQNENEKFDRVHQQVNLGMTFSVSEQLSGYFQVRSYWDWGQNFYGDTHDKENLKKNTLGYGFDGGRDNSVYLRQAYIDWLIPNTDVKVRMGRQNIALPALADGKNIVMWSKDPTDGITVNAPVTDWMTVNAFWARHARYADAAQITYQSDNIDVFGLAADMAFEGFKVTPFVAYAAIGDGMDPGAWTNNNKYIRGKSSTYWFGITGTMTYFDPFTVKASFVYGDRNFTSDDDPTLVSQPSQHGYFMEGSVSYKTAYGTPELLAFYGSGDSEDAKYAYQGSIPSVGGRFKGSYAFFNGSGLLDNEIENNHNGNGAWGVRLAWTGLSFIEDLSHDFAVVYAQGTNDSDNTRFGLNPSRYMTTDDSIVELDFGTTYKIYKNLTAYLEAAYVFENFETGVDKDRASSYDDAWKVALLFQYKF